MALRGDLLEAAYRRATGETVRDAAMRDLRELIPRAHRDGMPVAEIARLAGVTRQTVYTILAAGHAAASRHIAAHNSGVTTTT